jgi:RNA polymerase sigma-70 factor, ECF subfamily
MLPLPDVDITPALVARAQAGDTDAIAAIYAQYARPLLRFIVHRVGDPLVAEDLLHDVFVRMLAGLPAYQERGFPIGSWLYRIATCRVIDWRRRSCRRGAVSIDEEFELASDEWPDGERTLADQEAEQHTLDRALGQLTGRQAAVIRLRFFAELPIAEVAQRLGLPPGTIKALQHRGLATLRRQLQ